MRRTIIDVLLLSILLVPIACQKAPQTEPWFGYAKNYIEADAQMLREATQPTFGQNYELREKAKTLLEKAGAPSTSTLDALLRSTNDLDRKAALVTIMATKTNANELFAAILDRYKVGDDFFVKFYSQHCFENLSDAQITALEDRLISILAAEEDEAVITAGMPTLMRLDSAKSKGLLIKYMKTGSPGLRRTANTYINRRGNGFFEEIKAALEQDKAVDALKFLQKVN
ncbi:MAG TPA: hypothetical protein VKD28_14720 [Gemmatimonadales bacterium]|nr:hypothetical protein [Gemmatimonadales bacterium]